MWIANYLAVVAFALLIQDAYCHDMEMPPDVRAAIERYKVAAAKRMGRHITTDEVSDVLDSDEGLDLAMAQKLESSVNGRQKRKSMNFKSENFRKYKWPVDKPIPYKLDSSIHAEGAQTIRQSLDHIKAETCLRFSLTENPTENYILFQKASSSLSMIGRQTDKLEQIVRLSNVHIRNTGEIIHQVCHALGIWHEHQRPDRDQYIEVVTGNIEERELGDFRSVPSTVIDTAGLPYDYTSLMHFHGKTRSKNQELTLKAKDPLYQMAMGQRVGLSFLDAQLLNKVYCSETCGSTSPAKQCQHGGYTDPNKCNSCKCPDGFSGTYCGELAPSVGATCGGTLDAIPKEQELTSPGYGSAYDYNQECTWKIKAPATGKVQVRFDGDFSIFSPGGVCQHWVEIRKKTELGTYGPRFCGNDKPSTVLVSDGEELLVLFRAKYKNNQLASSSTGLHGFKLLYKAVNVAVSPCKSVTCQNGGSCNEQTYKCICPDGYSGDLCETGGRIRIDPCHPNPCVNGGSCQVDGSGYSCKCPAPFRGTNCDEASCGGCGGSPGSTDAPCYGDNFGAKEKCYTTVTETYYYYSSWSWRKCRGYRSRRVVKDCMCCANAVLIPPVGRRGEHYCAVTGWSDWGPCSDTCGGGEQFKRRYTVANQETYWGSSIRRLVVAEEESRECNTQECTGWERWYYGPRRRWGWSCCYGYNSRGGRCRK